jgi:hypothetical protein
MIISFDLPVVLHHAAGGAGPHGDHVRGDLGHDPAGADRIPFAVEGQQVELRGEGNRGRAPDPDCAA